MPLGETQCITRFYSVSGEIRNEELAEPFYGHKTCLCNGKILFYCNMLSTNSYVFILYLSIFLYV